MSRQAVVHGHFYQPPREEPWLELVPRERTAAPDHDWNERITGVLRSALRHTGVGTDGLVRGVRNAYAHCSFDVGPTLFRWLDRHAPAVVDAIVAADRASVARLGHGNAIAAPYHHVILPLASRRDKVTEVRWGIRDFAARFGRQPVGIWLPETAVDDETLEVVASEASGSPFSRPTRFRPPAPHGRPARWRGGNGRELAIFTYDGSLSHDIAFSPLMRDTDAWEQRFVAAADAGDGGPTIVSLATDGETFGHHHEQGDRYLALLIDRLDRRPDVELTKYAALLADHHRTMTYAQRPHLVELCPRHRPLAQRLRVQDGEPGTSHAWRGPAARGLEVVKAGIHGRGRTRMACGSGDMWSARESAGPDLAGVTSVSRAARRLLRLSIMPRGCSPPCGWFFDEHRPHDRD